MTFATKKSTRLKDPGAELLDQFTGYWDRYGRVTLAVLGVVAVAGVGALLYLRARSVTESKASGQLAQGEIMFWQGYYARSTEVAQQVIKQFPGTESASEAHRLAGDDAYWLDPPDFKKSVAEYRLYLKHRERGLLADAARRSLANALESEAGVLQVQGHPAEAVPLFREAADTYESLVGRFPDRETAAEFLLAAARCYRRIGQPQEAARRLERVTGEFGETQMANRARIELAEVTAGVP